MKLPLHFAVIFIAVAIILMLAACGFFDPYQLAGLKRYVYVANNALSDFSVSTYSVDVNGKLTRQGASIPTEDNPSSVAATYNSAFLYVTNSDSSSVSAYSIGSKGVLSEVPGSPFGAGTYPDKIAITHNDTYLYVADSGNNSVIEYSIGPDGALSLLGTITVSGSPSGIAITPNDLYLCVGINGSGGTTGAIITLRINTNGTLGTIIGGTLPTAFGDAVTLAIAPNGQFLFATDVSADTVWPYYINPDGTIVANGTPVALKVTNLYVSPQKAVVAPNNSCLYTVNNGGGISACKINSDGTLVELADSPFGPCPTGKDISITQDGSCIYATSNFDNKVYGFHTAANGSLSVITGSFSDTSAAPWGITTVTRWTQD